MKLRHVSNGSSTPHFQWKPRPVTEFPSDGFPDTTDWTSENQQIGFYWKQYFRSGLKSICELFDPELFLFLWCLNSFWFCIVASEKSDLKRVFCHFSDMIFSKFMLCCFECSCCLKLPRSAAPRSGLPWKWDQGFQNQLWRAQCNRS